MLFFAAFILIALVFFGARFLFSKAGIYLPTAWFKILLGIHLCLFLLALSTFILAPYNIYWRGYRSTSIIIIAAAITGLLCVWLHKGKLFGLFMVCVFIQTFIAAILVWEMMDSYKKSFYYSDDKYRLEYIPGFMSPYVSLPDLFIKKGLFERKIALYEEYQKADYDLDVKKIKSVAIKELSQQKINIVFTYWVDTATATKNSLSIDVNLGN